MEKGKLSQSELPHEIEGIELSKSFVLTLDSYIMDPQAWVKYLAKIIAEALKGKSGELIERFMESIEAYLILNQIENHPAIDSTTVSTKTENLNTNLFRWVIHYIYKYDQK